MKVHRLKILINYAIDVFMQNKTFEVRKDDRNYEVGDLIQFIVFDENGEPVKFDAITNATYKINYKLTSNDFPGGIKEGYCVLGIKEVEE